MSELHLARIESEQDLLDLGLRPGHSRRLFKDIQAHKQTFEEQGAEGLNLVPHSISGNAPKTPPAVSEAVSRAATPQNPMEDFERYYDSLVDVAGSSLGSGSLAGDTHDEEKGDAAADWISTVTTESLRDGDLPVVSDGGVLEVD